MSLLATSAESFVSYLFEHPTRSSLGLAVVAGVIGFFAAFRWLRRQPAAGDVRSDLFRSFSPKSIDLKLHPKYWLLIIICSRMQVQHLCIQSYFCFLHVSTVFLLFYSFFFGFAFLCRILIHCQ